MYLGILLSLFPSRHLPVYIHSLDSMTAMLIMYSLTPGVQEMAMLLERDRKLVEAQVKDLHSRLDEAEHNALKVSSSENNCKGK
jgi:hypothetical protein